MLFRDSQFHLFEVDNKKQLNAVFCVHCYKWVLEDEFVEIPSNHSYQSFYLWRDDEAKPTPPEIVFDIYSRVSDHSPTAPPQVPEPSPVPSMDITELEEAEKE